LAEAVCSEEDRERRVVLRLGVHRAQTVAEAALGDDEVVLRDREMAGVQGALALDAGQLVGRAVVGLDCMLELCIERLDLAQHPLLLGALFRDLWRLAGSGTGNDDDGREPEGNEAYEGRLPSVGARSDTPHHSRQAHREGPARHRASTLPGVPDTGNTEERLYVRK